jgi:alpha-galactosidase
MLEVGALGESPDGQDLSSYALDPAEAVTNFSIWAMWSAPLIAGNDPRLMRGTDLASQVLLNREIIAIDQDPLGRPATLVAGLGAWQVWRKPLTGGRTAIAVVNLADQPARADFSWAQLGVSDRPASLRDLWAHRDLAVAAGLHVQLAAHATGVYILG